MTCSSGCLSALLVLKREVLWEEHKSLTKKNMDRWQRMQKKKCDEVKRLVEDREGHLESGERWHSKLLTQKLAHELLMIGLWIASCSNSFLCHRNSDTSCSQQTPSPQQTEYFKTSNFRAARQQKKTVISTHTYLIHCKPPAVLPSPQQWDF